MTGGNSGGNNNHEHIKAIVPVYYTAYPELVPFSGGIDRAAAFGEESATACAQRKLREEARAKIQSGYPRRDPRNSRHQPTGNKLLRRARNLL